MPIVLEVCRFCPAPLACKDKGVCNLRDRASRTEETVMVSESEPTPTPKTITRVFPAGVPPTMFRDILCNFDPLWCAEVVTANEFMTINCRKPAVCLVWHEKDKRLYPMCHGCGSHNVINRGGRLIADATDEHNLISEAARRRRL